MARDSPQVPRPAGGIRQRGSGGTVAAARRSAPWTGTGRAAGPVSLREKKGDESESPSPQNDGGLCWPAFFCFLFLMAAQVFTQKI